MKARYLTLEFITTMQDIQTVQRKTSLKYKNTYNAFMFILMRHSLLAKSEVRIEWKDISELMFGGKLCVCTMHCE